MNMTFKVTCNVLVLCALFTGSVLCQSLVVSAAAGEWTMSMEPQEPHEMRASINITYVHPETKRIHSDRTYHGGTYGTPMTKPAQGLVVHVRSRKNNVTRHDGCTYPFDNNIPASTPWIALIRKGGCSFEQKLENAWLSKASAMVVYESQESRDEPEPGRYGFRHTAFSIPGIITYKLKGEEIAHLVDNGTNVTMHIALSDPRMPYNTINRTSVLFVSISFIVLMIISLAWLVFYYVQRFRYLHAKDRLAQRLCNAAKKALAKIPTRSVKLNDKETIGDDCCAVCIEGYRSGDMLRTLPCKHEFHKVCVDPWLLEHRTCPMCKMDILKFYGYIFTGSQESILHLDMDENALNSSTSRDTDSPTNESHHHFNPADEHHHPQTVTVLRAENGVGPGYCGLYAEPEDRRISCGGCSTHTPTHFHEHPMCATSKSLPERMDLAAISERWDPSLLVVTTTSKCPDSVIVHSGPPVATKDVEEKADKCNNSRRSSLVQCVICPESHLRPPSKSEAGTQEE